MIFGTVNAFREPVVRLEILGVGDVAQEIEAVVDTGFTGSLTLPSNLVAALGLRFYRRGRALLADGSASIFDVYEATVVWHGCRLRVAVAETGAKPLAGMGLLYGSTLMIDVVDGGTVEISPRP